MRTVERIDYMVTKRDWRSIYRYTCDNCGTESIWDTGDPSEGGGHVGFRDSPAREWIAITRGVLHDIANFCSLECLQKGVVNWQELPPPVDERMAKLEDEGS